MAHKTHVAIRLRGRENPVVVQYSTFCRRTRGGVWGSGCGFPILMCKTSTGKMLPVDPTPGLDGEYTVHWETCPKERHVPEAPQDG